MALTCSLSVNATSYAAGQSPPLQATLTVYNPNAVAVTVTSVQLACYVAGSNQVANACLPGVPPMGPGMLVTVPALSSINMGPFSIAMVSAANVNSFQMVNQADDPYPINPQPSQPANYSIQAVATVYGSDGSVNVSSPAGFTLAPQSSPPPGYQGNFLIFSAPNNLALGLTTGVL